MGALTAVLGMVGTVVFARAGLVGGAAGLADSHEGEGVGGTAAVGRACGGGRA